MSFLFLLTGSGLKFEIATCCDVLSGISLNFKDNGVVDSKDCCACIKASKKSSCCNTQSISTVINPVLGLQKALTLSAKQFTQQFVVSTVKNESFVSDVTVHNSIFGEFNQKEYTIPILIKKRVLQI